MTSAKPIIFFDVDGVLNTFTTIEEDKANGMGQVLSLPHVERLIAVQQASGALLVCASSWRKYEKNIAVLKSHDLWQGLFTEYDTPALPTRGHEVMDWLEWTSAGKDVPFVILDDRPSLYYAFPALLDKVSRHSIDSKKGLLDDHLPLLVKDLTV